MTGMDYRRDNDLVPWILSALVVLIMAAAVAISSSGPDSDSADDAVTHDHAASYLPGNPESAVDQPASAPTADDAGRVSRL